jgi:hypothetical protein
MPKLTKRIVDAAEIKASGRLEKPLAERALA